jgi:hypothetical protein
MWQFCLGLFLAFGQAWASGSMQTGSADPGISRRQGQVKYGSGTGLLGPVHLTAPLVGNPYLLFNLFHIGAHLLLVGGELQPHAVTLVHGEELGEEGVEDMRLQGQGGDRGH